MFPNIISQSSVILNISCNHGLFPNIMFNPMRFLGIFYDSGNPFIILCYFVQSHVIFTIPYIFSRPFLIQYIFVDLDWSRAILTNSLQFSKSSLNVCNLYKSLSIFVNLPRFRVTLTIFLHFRKSWLILRNVDRLFTFSEPSLILQIFLGFVDLSRFRKSFSIS